MSIVPDDVRMGFSELEAVPSALVRRLEAHGAQIVPPVAVKAVARQIFYEVEQPLPTGSHGVFMALSAHPCPTSPLDLCLFLSEPIPQVIGDPRVSISGFAHPVNATLYSHGPGTYVMEPPRLDRSRAGDLEGLADQVLDHALQGWGCVPLPG